MYLTHGSRAGSVEGFGDRDGRRGARGTEDHREVRGIGDSSESLVGSDPGDIAGKQQPRTCRADAAPHDGRRPGRGQEGAGCQRRFPVITARSMECSSEPGVIAAGAGALPRARRRCEAGKRTHGPGPRACLALLAATALLALAAPAQAQTEVWSATLTPANFGSGFIGCANETGNSPKLCSTATVLSDDDFTHDSTDYSVIALHLSAGGTLTLVLDADITTATAALTLVVGTTSLPLADAPTSGPRYRIWSSPGLSWTAGTAIDVKLTAPGTPNTAPTAANNTVTTGEDRAYAFTADDFGFDDADAGDTLASVTIVTPPALGTLALDGTAVMADDVVTKAQIDGDMLTFTPARDAHGDPYTAFTFTVNDGTDDSAIAYTMTIDVTDAPVPVCGVPDIAGDGRREIWTGTVTVEEFSSWELLLVTDFKHLQE